MCGLATILVCLTLSLVTVANAAEIYGLYEYEIVDNSYVKITDLAIEDKDREAVMSVSIPTTIDGYPVQEIAGSVFRNCVNLSGVSIPDSVLTLGCGAFKGCTSLSSVEIPAQMNTAAYTGDNYMYPGPFIDCSSLNTIVFREGRTTIPQGLFYGCTGLRSIVIPGSITSISSRARSFQSKLSLYQTTENLCAPMD